jgi:uncharacterized protein
MVVEFAFTVGRAEVIHVAVVVRKISIPVSFDIGIADKILWHVFSRTFILSDMSDPSVTPVRAEERISSVDVLRGFSLLGILLLNIVSFGLPFAAYSNPSVYGGADGANLTFWLADQVLFEGKMRAIFSMLFGASVIILTSRAERRGAGIELADVYYRRTLWLIVIGVVHGYLIWYGDILFAYAVVGLLLFPFRKLSGRALVMIGAGILLFHSVQGFAGMFYFRDMQKKIAEITALETAGKALTEEQKTTREEWEKMRKMVKPDQKDIDKEIAAMRGGYLANLKHRAPVTAMFQTEMFFQFLIWDVAGMLIIGMGLMKLGVFDASRSYKFYAWMAAIGYGIGIPLNWIMASLWIKSGFDFIAGFGYMMAPSDLGRFTVAAGHVAVVVMLVKAGALGWVTKPLANIGRMALSNYLLTSVLCTAFFYGFGFGMFAKLQRAQLLYVLATMWTVNLVFSAVWMRYYRFGPAEWLWRSLTYCKKQPMRIVQPVRPVEQALETRA